jgi:hypothetical protein
MAEAAMDAGTTRRLAWGLALVLAACGGGGSHGNFTAPPPPPPPPPPPALDPAYPASGATPFTPGCDGVPAQGMLYVDAEVEPSLAIDRVDPRRLVGVWQQDRWSTGGARGLVAGVSSDAGHTWTRQALAFTRCGGGSAANGGDYARGTDPWVSGGPDGSMHLLALAYTGFALAAGSTSAVLAARSGDGGATWSAPSILVRDGDGAHFDDKCSITADPVDARYVYAVWDRISAAGDGPAWFARSTDGGQAWEPARAIYHPGADSQTLGNIIVVTPNGTLVDAFSEIHGTTGPEPTAVTLSVIRSTDNGATWSTPVVVAQQLSVGTRDPDSGRAVRDGSLVPSIAAAPGGAVFVAWQDARFSGGAHDGIAIARSDDGGLTWSAPAQANAAPAVAAFEPMVHARGDGAVGLTYFDFRDNTPDPATLPTDLWLAVSADGSAWHEWPVAAGFDLALAPLAAEGAEGGYFLGDYQGLDSAGTVFVPFFARTTGAAANRTDVFAAPAVSAAAGVAAIAARAHAPVPAARPGVIPSEAFRRRVVENATRVLGWRLRGHEGEPGEGD